MTIDRQCSRVSIHQRRGDTQIGAGQRFTHEIVTARQPLIQNTGPAVELIDLQRITLATGNEL